MESSVVSSLKEFLSQGPRNDDEVHAYAEKLGIDPHQLEGMIYGIAYKALTGQYLKMSDADDGEFDSQQLSRGIEVEKEHTDDPSIAKTIAKAHLKEIPDYYTRLDAMEKSAKGESAFDRYGSKFMVENVNDAVRKVIPKMFIW